MSANAVCIAIEINLFDPLPFKRNGIFSSCRQTLPSLTKISLKSMVVDVFEISIPNSAAFDLTVLVISLNCSNESLSILVLASLNASIVLLFPSGLIESCCCFSNEYNGVPLLQEK